VRPRPRRRLPARNGPLDPRRDRRRADGPRGRPAEDCEEANPRRSGL